MRFAVFLVSVLATAVVPCAALAADVPAPAVAHPAPAVDFARDVRPILRAQCYACHGPEKQKGGLRLDLKKATLAGGESHGPAVKPGAPGESPLLKFVTAGPDDEDRMPPKGDRLTPAQIAVLKAWVEAGAEWPDGADDAMAAPAAKDKADHWAFKPVVRPAVPTVADGKWARNDIDRFIQARLEKANLKPSADADRVSWLRRVSFDLTGLPPTPAEVDAFLADKGEAAFGRVVDRLLASPAYGERWARHWLDVIAFGETDGFEVNTPRDNAWPYRDYVIRAFNDDVPYTKFVHDQLAGDLTGEDPATGFIVSAAALKPEQVGEDEEAVKIARQDQLNSMVMGTGVAFLGMSVSCARCHDHKFDPIAQRDYYSMQATFAGVKFGERPWKIGGPKRAAEIASVRDQVMRLEAKLAEAEPLAEPQSAEVAVAGGGAPARPAVDPTRVAERFAPVRAKRLRFTVTRTNAYEPCIDELEVFAAGAELRNVAAADAGATVTASGTYAGSPLHRLEHLNDGRYGNGRSWISNENGKGWVQVEFAREETIDRVAWSRDREGKFADRLAVGYRVEVATAGGPWVPVASSADRRPYAGKLAKGDVEPATAVLATAVPAEMARLLAERATLIGKLSSLSAEPMVWAGILGKPEPIHLLNRGDPGQPREPIAPGALAKVGQPLAALPADASDAARRLALADWIADARNPLTARVMVNRLWQHHFGEGIVDTPSDLGNNGGHPTHPELIDWLADEFVRQGWSVKAMHRLICLSSTYRQSSQPSAAGLAADAGTRLLWRFPPRRMEAEQIRDAILSAAGTLDRRMGGPGFSAFAPNENYVRVYNPKTEYGPADWRRMVYQTKVRIAQDSTFGAFDCPDAGLPQPRRPRSTTPLQALNLFNSQFVHQQSELFADRVKREAGDDPAKQVARAFTLALNREPEAEEASASAELVKAHGLPTLCRVVLNLNEFVFVR